MQKRLAILITKRSLPSRERGLKQKMARLVTVPRLSLPSRERGLKLNLHRERCGCDKSLPSRERGLKQRVDDGKAKAKAVAPLAGARIETPSQTMRSISHSSLPSRERGLKQLRAVQWHSLSPSLPSRERGLKLSSASSTIIEKAVAPLAGARIEMSKFTTVELPLLSLPSRERGLKYHSRCI